MLALFAPLPGTRSAIGHGSPYEDAGIITLALALSAGTRRAWTRAVAGFWAGHRKTANGVRVD